MTTGESPDAASVSEHAVYPSRTVRWVVTALAVGAVIFHLYAAGVAPFTALIQRPVHLGLMAVIGLLGVGTLPRRHPRSRIHRRVAWLVSGLLIAAAVLSFGYLVAAQETLARRAGTATTIDLVAGVAAVIIVLELARRSTGWGLVAVALLALVYSVAGPYLPGVLAHRGYGVSRLVQHLYLSTEGIWGVPLGVSADFVYLFVLFGVLLEYAGGGQLLIALAGKVAGRTLGGPAKTAVVASGIMGSLSGSAVANVVTTGSMTIPMMKRTGFRPHLAGAIEAAASTGGQLMPPIMGAGAFILATWTNIPYVRVAAAAAIPAVLYYLALFAGVHFHAAKLRLRRAASEPAGTIAARLHLLLPLVLIVVLLAMGRSPMRAAFWGVATAALFIALGAVTRMSVGRTLEAIRAAASGTVQVASATAAAGIVVGVASLTGIGLRMSEFIVLLSGGNLFPALVLTAVGSIVLGMGLPTTAAYVVLAALGAPALTQLGVPMLGAHLFIFYFGCLSNVTPPVSLAAFAGAGLAGAPQMRTAFTAMSLAGAGFVVPFLFIYQPSLILSGSPLQVVWSATTAAAGIVALALAGVGYGRAALTGVDRLVLATGAAALLTSFPIVNVVGAAIVGVSLHRHRRSAPILVEGITDESRS